MLTPRSNVIARSEAWNAKFQELFVGCSLRSRLSADFDGWCLDRGDESMRMVECVCDPCRLHSPRRELGSSPDVLGVQVVMAGQELFSIGDERFVLNAGDVLVWDTTRVMSVEVTERLHKVSIMLPLSRLQSWLPTSW